jgi:hypothetical protein
VTLLHGMWIGLLIFHPPATHSQVSYASEYYEHLITRGLWNICLQAQQHILVFINKWTLPQQKCLDKDIHLVSFAKTKSELLHKMEGHYKANSYFAVNALQKNTKLTYLQDLWFSWQWVWSWLSSGL